MKTIQNTGLIKMYMCLKHFRYFEGWKDYIKNDFGEMICEDQLRSSGSGSNPVMNFGCYQCCCTLVFCDHSTN
jgi:hypothetical protein